MTRPLDPETWRRVEVILDKVLGLPPNERGAAVEVHCAGDDELREHVERLLAADERAGEFLDGPVEEFASPLLRNVPMAADDALAAGTMVGAYRIVRELGRGGMGFVYLAERADGQFTQQVALKLIRPGMDSRTIRARFLQERQILAGLQHPGIARLLDGGVLEGGQPFFALEYVDGLPVTEFADRHRLRIDDRIELFRDVCEAVAYAQRHLVVHRDIKPSNVLITAAREVKLLDFGIAKLFAQDGDDLGLTQDGSCVLTPEYAAPEQIRDEAVTTATDVYALGCVLFELLSGHHPYATGRTPRGELERAVLSGELPAMSRVVTRTVEFSHGDESTTLSPDLVSSLRGTSVRALRRRLAGDLSAIVTKAMAQDPDHRYLTAEALGEDLRRHRTGIPIVARAPSTLYRARKYVARHKVGVAAAAVIALSLIGGLVATAWQADRAEREARRATEARDFLVNLFEATDPDRARGRELTAAELLDEGARRIATDLADAPELQAEMQRIVGRTYLALGKYALADSLFRQALQTRTRRLGPTHPATIESLSDLAQAAHSLSRYAQAESLLTTALELEVNAHGESHPRVARTVLDLATVKRALGKFEEADPLYTRAIDIDRAYFGARHEEVASDLGNYAVFLGEQGRYEEAETADREALSIYRAGSTPRGTDAARILSNLGHALSQRGDYAGAEAALREAVELRPEIYQGSHPRLAHTLRNLGAIRGRRDDLPGAKELLEEALSMSREDLGEIHEDVANCLNELAVNAFHRGDLPQARDRFAESLAVFEQLLPADHPTILTMNNNLATIALEVGDIDRAEVTYDRVLRLRREKFGDDHPDVGQAWITVGSVHGLRERWDRAVESYREALRIFRDTYGGDANPQTTMGKIYLGRALGELELFDEGEGALRAALGFAEQELGDQHRETIRARLELGRLLAAAGRPGEALPFAESAAEYLLAARGKANPRTADARAVQGICLAALGRVEEARAALSGALAVLERERGPDYRDTRRAAAALERLR